MYNMCDFLDDSSENNVTNMNDHEEDHDHEQDQYVNIEDNQSVCSGSTNKSDDSESNGVNVDDMSISKIQEKEKKEKNTPYFSYNNQKIYIPVNELNTQSVIMAALFNYSDEKNESKFENICLPIIKIKYNHLVHLFFTNCVKGFSPIMINTLWKGIKGFSLAKTYLKIKETQTGINSEQLSALTKIKLHKDCAFKRITEKAFHMRALNLEELNIALGSIDSRPDDSISVNITIHLYSSVLDVGLILTFPFSVTDVPDHVRGVVGDDEHSILFDFC